MCMLFIYINNEAENDEYHIVIANNRDELWNRPTATAELKGDRYPWIGGRDLQPGREGGTWLGLSATGKLGILLNILAPQSLDKQGRGMLVSDFLEGETTCSSFLTNIAQHVAEYNPFQLILLDRSDKPMTLHHLNSISGEVTTHSSGVYSFDNSTDSLNIPWKKTSAGEQQFRRIVQENNQTDKQSTSRLVRQLVDLLNDKSQHLPDPQLTKQFQIRGHFTDTDVFHERSALNVFSPSIQYGTRTNTVILIDRKGRVHYEERTMETPVDVANPKWTSLIKDFTLGNSNSAL